MASLFGSLATELGSEMQEISADKREERMVDEDHQRELQLQKMRMKHDSMLTDRRITADDRRQARRLEFEGLQNQAQIQADIDAAALEREHDIGITTMQEESDIIQTIIRGELSNRNTRRMSGEGWSVEFDREQVIDPNSETGFSMQDIVNATAPSGRPYRIVGDMAFPAGGSTTPKTSFATPDLQKQAEAPLYSGEITPETFRSIHGYIPSDYIFGRVTREEPQIRSIIESTLGRQPAWMSMSPARTGGGSGTPESKLRDTMDDDYQWPPAPEMKPSMEEMSEGPERDAHIAAQGGKTNAEIAAERRSETGGALAQAQADEDLEQGGNLEEAPTMGPPAPETATPEPVAPEPQASIADPDRAFQGARDFMELYREKPWIRSPAVRERMGLPDLSDDDAADVAEAVVQSMSAP